MRLQEVRHSFRSTILLIISDNAYNKSICPDDMIPLKLTKEKLKSTLGGSIYVKTKTQCRTDVKNFHAPGSAFIYAGALFVHGNSV